MKASLYLSLALLFFSPLTPSASARAPVPIDFFYDNLDPYGTWREVGDYGYCWQPQGVPEDWRPYSDGRWVYTDAGWTWDSDEPFGWAVYHYGRWANLDRYGWIWVPGTEWGPGWVSWRHSPRHIGWAPLPPEAAFLHNVGFSVWVDDYFNIGPANYRFIENRDFGASRLNTVFVDQSQNTQIIHQTTNVTHITYVNNVIHNGGPRFDQLSQQSRIPIQRYNLERRQDFDGDPNRQTAENLRSRVQGTSLSVIAPVISDHSNAPPPRIAEKAIHTEINHGWKNAGSTAEVQALRERMKGGSRVPEALPAQPRFQRPATPPAALDPTGHKPSIIQPAPAITKREDNPRDPNAPPIPPRPPEQKPSAADRPPMPAPAEKPAPAVPQPPTTSEKKPKLEPRPEKDPPPRVAHPFPEPAKPNADRKPEVRMPFPPPQIPPARAPVENPRPPETRRPGERPTPTAPRPPQPQPPQERMKPPTPPAPPQPAPPRPTPPAIVPPPIPPHPVAPQPAPPPHGKRPEGREPNKPAKP